MRVCGSSLTHENALFFTKRCQKGSGHRNLGFRPRGHQVLLLILRPGAQLGEGLRCQDALVMNLVRLFEHSIFSVRWQLSFLRKLNCHRTLRCESQAEFRLVMKSVDSLHLQFLLMGLCMATCVDPAGCLGSWPSATCPPKQKQSQRKKLMRTRSAFRWSPSGDPSSDESPHGFYKGFATSGTK